MKDNRFHQQYTKLIQEILEKGYAKESKSTPQGGRVWYLPHHGVYHPRKPDKIRVVFDCSSKLNGRSINKELLMGLDLTNQLIGVLTRFRQEEVAVIADIEKMYVQILVADEHRSLLRFLWWKDGDMSKEIIDHEMCVHVFGSVSSGACSNYALKRTAIENKNKYGKDAAETLKNNFYVDDMLKSVENEDKAITLMKGGFNMTKFASSSKRVLQSIPEKDRKMGVKNSDLLRSLPEERALGVLWNVENDTLGFKVNLKEKPLARRGVLSVLNSIYDPLGFVHLFY